MRKLAILTFQTLDGVMQAPSHPDEDRSGDFKHGGWAQPFWEEVMEQVGREAMAEPYDLLLGRTTYDIFASSFVGSNTDNPRAKKLTTAKKYVVTSHSEKLAWQNSEKITGDIVAEISRLKQQDGPLLQVHGSWQLIQTLLAHDSIDEFRLWTFPVIVGAGKRLFEERAVPNNLRLIKSDTCPTGAIMSIYNVRNKTAQ
ncbi:MAG: dihydrofolate reductase family protein [Sulfurimonas sp.]|nr:dihydrofolate reductase family protein [Sulfurimonas sp.]PHQ91415.1 MAG: riboflavin biosynthesis protein RibD [Sulfurimonas sp.]